ncbi:hypothetical protein NDU88_004570 [Pleurodeles waltl]|uniref:Uncharacterized protein n=1 Tax=Pleurodeles waltl TaxID=8319 RepID=A0AAV7TSY7_PLEWA|nr:hypothetical protein NDU88_004570 [Pleurodeles waltl]
MRWSAGPSPPPRRGPATACRPACPAQAHVALDHGGPRLGRTRQGGPTRPPPGKEQVRMRAQRVSSPPQLTFTFFFGSDLQDLQPGCSRGSPQHPQHTSPGGPAPAPAAKRPGYLRYCGRSGPGRDPGIHPGVTRQPPHSRRKRLGPTVAGAGSAATPQSPAPHHETGPACPESPKHLQETLLTRWSLAVHSSGNRIIVILVGRERSSLFKRLLRQPS